MISIIYTCEKKYGNLIAKLSRMSICKIGSKLEKISLVLKINIADSENLTDLEIKN